MRCFIRSRRASNPIGAVCLGSMQRLIRLGFQLFFPIVYGIIEGIEYEFRLSYLLSHGWMICFFRKFNLLFLYYYYFFYLCNVSADLMLLLD